jgi:hypothetical protein
MISAPGIVGGEKVKEDSIHPSPCSLQVLDGLAFHSFVSYVDVHALPLGYFGDKLAVGSVDGLDFARPTLLFVWPAEPHGLLGSKLCGKIVAERCGGYRSTLGQLEKVLHGLFFVKKTLGDRGVGINPSVP